jgi:predicted TIM-barrel fold metal-dependent hydrolase
MRLIDAHVHLYPPEVGRDPAAWAAAQGEPHWAELCTRRRRDGRPVQTFPEVDGLLRDMDAAGIERAVLQGWYWERPATCAWQNRFFARCVRAHPDRLAAFATFHPAAGEAAVLAEIRRAQAEGLRGLGELSPHSQGYGVDDPVLGAALALAGELRLPVNLHTSDRQARNYPGKVDTPPEDFLRLAPRFPATTFILAHWGGGVLLLESNPRVRQALANVRYDTAASPLIYDDRIWRAALDVVPAEKVLFGTDYPLVLYPQTEERPGWGSLRGEIDGAGLTPDEQAALLAGNAAKMFGW